MKTPNHLKKAVMWHKVIEYKSKGLNKSQISRKLNIDRATVRKYLSMDEQSFYLWLEKSRVLPKKLRPYQAFIEKELGVCSELSAAQIEDRLKEHFPDMPPVHSKTIYNFVKYVRGVKGISKPNRVRVYEKLDELPYGEQAQVDFGCYNMKTSHGTVKKVYFFCMVLSRARQKYIYYQSQPFTAKTTIDCHDRAFEYFHGQPKKILYDQDRVLMVNENLGDFILTKEFSAYSQQMPFESVFCRKADPESKGKVENVVGFVQKNFLRGRIYRSDDILNEESLAWLSRTGNGKMHWGIRKIPHQEWLIEQTHLLPYNKSAHQKDDQYKEYIVRKDSTISFRGNFYTITMGYYKGPQTKVLVKLDDDNLLIFDNEHQLITSHPISLHKGLTVRNDDYRRQKSDSLEVLKAQSLELMNQTQSSQTFIELLAKQKSRYLRDNLMVLIRKLPALEHQHIEQACDFCLENQIYNASRLVEVAQYRQKQGVKSNVPRPSINIQAMILPDINRFTPETTPISIYENLM
jgi:transposase